MSGATPLRVKALRDFGLYYGIAFQMLDDLLDFTADEAELGKPVGNDLREHKMTIPLILALENEKNGLRPALKRFFSGSDSAEPLIAAVGEAGGFLRTREAITGYVERAKMSLAPLGTAPARAELVALADALARDSASRVR